MGFLKLFQRVGLKNRIDSKQVQVKLYCIFSIEALVIENWVFNFLVEVVAEVLVFMPSKVRFASIGVPDQMLAHRHMSRHECVDDIDRGVDGQVAYRDEGVSGQMNSIL